MILENGKYEILYLLLVPGIKPQRPCIDPCVRFAIATTLNLISIYILNVIIISGVKLLND